MNKSFFNILGWILLICIGVLWLIYGYLSIYLLLVPLASIAFSISDGSILKMKKIKELTFKQSMLIIMSFIISVALILGLLILAHYIINTVFELSGWAKTISQIIAVILSLYPIKLTFWSMLDKVNRDINEKRHHTTIEN